MPASVVIYEDDDGIRTVLVDVLEMEGLDVGVCTTVFELHQAAIAGARVAITDSWGKSYEVLDTAEREQIRALARMLPTILISGRGWAAAADEYDLGLAGLLTKPFDVDELLRCVRRFVACPEELPERQPQSSRA
jgi:DNA-binding NtrC family response regulator